MILLIMILMIIIITIITILFKKLTRDVIGSTIKLAASQEVPNRNVTGIFKL